MYNNATFIDKEQLKNLKKIDTWLDSNKYRYDEHTFMELRQLITKIQEKGFYYESEAEILNMVADEYNQSKKKNKL
jgi:hypothetical protein